MQVRNIRIGRTDVLGIEIPLTNAVLVMAVSAKGFVMCGYLDVVVAEKLGDCAAIVRGVKNIDELLLAKVAEMTSAARKIGIKKGMTGRMAIVKML